MNEPVEVTVQIGDRDVVAGTLWFHHRAESSATFRYADEFLDDPAGYPLDPALPLAAGIFHTQSGTILFNAFTDSAPDRWGRNLMRRQERERANEAKTAPRTLTEADFLLGVRDDVRQGAVRFRVPGTEEYYSTHSGGVPRVFELGRLLRAVDHLDATDPADRDLFDLIDAGSSLGGARPKAAVITESGKLAIAKFPRVAHDDWDVTAWEKLELDLAQHAGLNVAQARLVEAGDRRALIVERFDRRGGRRIGFTSALAMLEAADLQQRSYLEIAEAIESHSPQAETDLRELFRRIVFSILTGNSDDHLRNHGFLRETGGWVLSPAYDLNPNPHRPDRLTTAIDLDDSAGGIDLALSVCEYFRLTLAEAKKIVAEVESTTRHWRGLAARLTIPATEIDLMASALDSEQRRIARKRCSATA